MQEAKIKVQYREINKLKLLENNPRTITERQLETLKESIKSNPDYFEARPLIISNRTGENVIIAGNQRYRAAKALGLTQVPCVVLEGLTEEREREIIIRDNVSNGAWDFDLLANEWDETKLANWGVEAVFKAAPLDMDSFFEQSDEAGKKEPKKVTCPHCGEEFEL